MQTLNILDDQFSQFNTLSAFDSCDLDNSRNTQALLEQLQTTLDLEKLLNIFAMQATKHVEFFGLSFKNEQLTHTIRGSQSGKAEQKFDLKINNEFIGILTYSINSPIKLAHYKILHRLHQYLVYPIKNAILYHQATQLARQDSLTHLGNRRYFDEQLKRAMHHAKRQHSSIGLIVCDLNKFKQINDTFGHHIGDQVLTHFADALRKSSRDSDSIFRFGGDEFTILVENASKPSLDIIKTRVNRAVQQDKLLAKYQVSCSLGITFMLSTDNEKTLFQRADQALYQEKMFTATTEI